jgi:hypothetical protein
MGQRSRSRVKTLVLLTFIVGLLLTSSSFSQVVSIQLDVTSPASYDFILPGMPVTVHWKITYLIPVEESYSFILFTGIDPGAPDVSHLPDPPIIIHAVSGHNITSAPIEGTNTWNTSGLPDGDYRIWGGYNDVITSSNIHLLADFGHVSGLVHIINKPPTPVLSTWTPDVSSGQTYTLDWNYMVCTESYELQESESYSMNSPHTYTLNDAGTLSKQLSHVNSGSTVKKYYYRVRAVNGTYGKQGDWSNILTVNVSASPAFIVVDGNKDSFYGTLTGPSDGYLQLRSYAYNDNGRPSSDADLSAKIWTAWDEQWFYLYEEVRDDVLSASSPNVWEEDCLELKVDPQPTSAANSIWETRFTALGAGAGVSASDELGSVQDSQKQWARKTVSGGYVLELAVQWSAIKSGSETITPSAGMIFGAAINQHDNDGAGRREASVQWAAVLADAAWNTPADLGTVKLLSGHKLEFKARSNITGVINPVPYDGRDYTPSGIEAGRSVLEGFALEQNYPNPFNPETTVVFSLKSSGKVRLSVVDETGREVAVLTEGYRSTGRHEAVFSGKDLTSGIYFCRLETADGVFTRKMTLMK